MGISLGVCMCTLCPCATTSEAPVVPIQAACPPRWARGESRCLPPWASRSRFKPPAAESRCVHVLRKGPQEPEWLTRCQWAVKHGWLVPDAAPAPFLLQKVCRSHFFRFHGTPQKWKTHQKSVWICYPSQTVERLLRELKAPALHSLGTLQLIHAGLYAKDQSLILSSRPLSQHAQYLQHVCHPRTVPFTLCHRDQRDGLAASKLTNLTCLLMPPSFLPKVWTSGTKPVFQTPEKFVFLTNLATGKPFSSAHQNWDKSRSHSCIYLITYSTTFTHKFKMFSS